MTLLSDERVADMGKIILTSQGLCTQMGDRLIHRAISDMGDRENKKILLVDIKKYRITEKLKDACISMGFEKSNIFVTSEAEAGDFSDFFSITMLQQEIHLKF